MFFLGFPLLLTTFKNLIYCFYVFQSAAANWKEDALVLIAAFFKKFSFVKQPTKGAVESKMSQLEKKFPKCNAKWVSSQNVIEIVGVAEDVEKISLFLQQALQASPDEFGER